MRREREGGTRGFGFDWGGVSKKGNRRGWVLDENTQAAILFLFLLMINLLI